MICLVFKLSKNILAYFQNYFPTSQFPQLIHPPGARHPAWGQERRYWSDPSVQTTPPLRPPPSPRGCGRGFSNRPGNPRPSGGGGETLRSLLWLASPVPPSRTLGRAAVPVPGVLYGRDPNLAQGKTAELISEDSLQRGTPRSLWVSFSIYPDKYSPDPEAKRQGTLNTAFPAPQKAALMGRAEQWPLFC